MRSVSCALTLSLAVLFAATVVGCNQTASTDTADDGSQPAAAIATANQYCPIMGGKVSTAGGTAEWNGQTIGFCCAGCIDSWQALSDEEKAEKLAAADAKAEGNAGHEGH